MKVLLLFALLTAFAAPTLADIPPDQDQNSDAVAQVQLIAAETSHDGTPILAGIHLQLAPGWRTYWRNPGDSGIAPRFNWSGSRNLASIDLRWPVPKRFDERGDVSYGYTGDIVWPILLRVNDPAKPVHVSLQLFYGICSNICVPASANVELDIPAGHPHASRDIALIRAALARVPLPPVRGDDIGVKLEGKQLVVNYNNVDEMPSLIVEGPDGISFGTPVAVRRGADLLYRVPIEAMIDASLHRAKLTLTFSGVRTAVEARRSLR